MGVYDTVPRVRVFPNGPKKDAVYLVFVNKQEKEKYIKDEYRFCFEFERSHNAAMTTNARTKSKEALYARRVAFAKVSGFAPKPGEHKIWVKQQFSDNDSVA